MKVRYVHEIPMGHRLQHHEGRCRFLHGHNYLVAVSYEGPVNPDTGMVVDFSELKKGVRKVMEKYDHAFVLENSDPSQHGIAPFSMLHLVPYPPTAENLSQMWRREIADTLSVPYHVVAVTVFETRDCVVEA